MSKFIKCLLLYISCNFVFTFFVSGEKSDKEKPALRLKEKDSTSIISLPNLQTLIGCLNAESTSILVFRENEDIIKIDITKSDIKISISNKTDDIRIDTFDYYNSDGIPESRITTQAGRRIRYEIFFDGKFCDVSIKNNKFYLNENQEVYLENGDWNLKK